MNEIIILTAKYLFLLVILGSFWVGYSQDREGRKQYICLFVIAGILALAITKLAGALYFDPRPFVVHHFQPLIPHEADNGFPSDHTVLSSFAALVALRFHKKMGIVLFGLALIVGIARVLSGIHSPLDVGVGIAIGAVSVGVGWLINHTHENV